MALGSSKTDSSSGVVVVHYGQPEFWESRKSAEEYYMNRLQRSEGAEQQRYVTIYTKLRAGVKVCTDLNY